ncbi:beta-L-arabinofuranosidase domain-containing protein [Pedobacter vanadiisoli]|uniref:Beta-L-arabinofuranosidase domain-containing protein n=1 Tax=Pedobacter vanadiisoli TaxID=1761975 RepID=A0ABW5MIY0_9SPHI
MFQKLVITFLFILVTLNCFSQHPAVLNTAVSPFNDGEVSLSNSGIKHREELDISFLNAQEPDRLLHNFRLTAGLPSTAKPLGGWEAPGIGLRGHFVGHYLSAVSHLVEKYHQPELTSKLKYMIDELYKCQKAFGNGYLSAFPDKDFKTLETKFTGVWAPYYTYQKIMQAMLDVYIHTQNKKAYEILLGMASYVDKRMAALPKETQERMMYTVEANPQNEMGAMNEVLYKLYAISKDPKHLALAKIFDPQWFFNPLLQNRDILSGLHSNTHLVLVNGFSEGYNTTGDIRYREAATNFWEILMKGHAYVNGSSSGPRPNATTKTSLTAEHWGEPGHLFTLSKEIAESCVSHNTQKLTSSLFTWTADAKYADAYMNMFYNAVLPAQSNSTGAFIYHLPLGSPRNKKYLKENDYACCTGSCAEAFAQLNTRIYYHNDSALYVNLYVPSKVEWKRKNISLEQKGELPKDSLVNFMVKTKKSTGFSLKLFIPSWAQGTEVYLNKKKLSVNAEAGSYLNLNRTWKDNDEVELIFHYGFQVKQMPDSPQVISISYGPALLAFETENEVILKGGASDLLKNLSVLDHNNNTFQLKNFKKNYTLRPLYDVDAQSYGVYATLRDF